MVLEVKKTIIENHVRYAFVGIGPWENEYVTLTLSVPQFYFYFYF